MSKNVYCTTLGVWLFSRGKWKEKDNNEKGDQAQKEKREPVSPVVERTEYIYIFF